MALLSPVLAMVSSQPDSTAMVNVVPAAQHGTGQQGAGDCSSHVT
jgi:hypothetical protein